MAETKEAGETNNGHEFFQNILNTYKVLIARERSILNTASEMNDESTVALMSDFIREQEKTVWMLVAASEKHCQK